MSFFVLPKYYRFFPFFVGQDDFLGASTEYLYMAASVTNKDISFLVNQSSNQGDCSGTLMPEASI